MTLPNFGVPLSLSDIQGEFGGSTPLSLGNYYAGGGLVPGGTSGQFGAIPSSGTISIHDFYGASNGGGFVPYNSDHPAPGGGNEIVPTGATSVVITIVGPGGPGGNSNTDAGSDSYASGGGGGGAGAAVKTLAVASSDWGTSIAWVAAQFAGFNSTATGSLLAGSIAMTAPYGTPGGSSPSFGSAGTGSAGTTGTGGDTNYTGGNGADGQASSSSGLSGGAGGTAPLGGAFASYGIGGAGADSPGAANLGSVGFVRFAWT